MRTAGRDVLLTNFSGGLNTYDDSQNISNAQLTKAQNVVITRDGSIQNRPGLHFTDNVSNISSPTSYRFLGFFGDHVLWQTDDTVDTLWACDMSTFDPSARAFVNGGSDPTVGSYVTGVPVTGESYLKSLAYLDNLVLISFGMHILVVPYTGATNLLYPGVSTATDIAGQAFGGEALIWKDRLFLTSTDGRIYYSAATNLTDFSAPNGGYFTPGSELNLSGFSAGSIQKLLVVGDVMYIFKKNSVHAFTFQTDPGTDGFVRLLSADQGAIKATTWQNRIFTVDKQGVYEFNNGRFLKISANVQSYFLNGYTPVDLFVYEDYLLVMFTTLQTTTKLCMNLLNGAWTVWDSPVSITKSAYLEVSSSPAGPYHIVMGDVTGNTKAFSYISNKAPKYDTVSAGVQGSVGTTGTPGTSELRPISLETKMFTFESPWKIKKIYRIFIDRGNSYSASPVPSYGWSVKFYNPDNVENTITYPASDNRFGRLVLGGAFRCYHFRILYDFAYSGSPATNFDLNINTIMINYRGGSDYSKSDGTFNK